MIKKIIVLIFIISVTTCNYGQENQKKIKVIDYNELKNQKKLIKSGDTKAVKNYNALIKQANILLESPSFSVVNKTGVPPSGNKHDYMSIGPYWWPNPNTKNGLPYIRKDGEINPETQSNFTDVKQKSEFIYAVKTLCEAYYFSNEIKYAQKNIAFINAWFLNEATKMRPNINYGQYVPGKSEGRSFGIIEFEGVKEVIKFLELAKDSGVLNTATQTGMYSWFVAYSNWLINSKLGKQAVAKANNHGTHYDVQLLCVLIYLNKIEAVKNHLLTLTAPRIFSQIEPNGSQPLELKRTKSFSYSVMNLHGFLELVIIGKKVGVDLWNIESEDGRSIKAAFTYMLPYITNKKKWEYPQIKDKKHSEYKLISDLIYIKRMFKEDSFDKALSSIHQLDK